MISRTRQGIKNARIAIFFLLLNLLLNFFSRKVFIDYLGIDVLGLNTTATNLLGFLNLAELGIGTAISYVLYLPLHRKDRETINEIVSVQGWMYRRIAYLIIVLALLLMCFFSVIFSKINLPLWYAYASFISLLASSLLGYFINYKQIILSADQKEYKINICYQSVKILKVLMQMFAMIYSDNGYVYWLLIEILMACASAVILNNIVHKEYPWLSANVSDGNNIRKNYPQIIVKTKQLFFHKIGYLVLSQTTPLIIYAYASLSVVAIYGNYMLIIVGVTSLVIAMLNSIGAGVGNLVAEGNKNKIVTVFYELVSFRFWLASVICFSIYKLMSNFIIIWIGEEYLLEQSVFIVLIFYTFLLIVRTHDIFISAYGLFQDIWSPIIEAILNLGLSIILGAIFGIMGVILGSTLSLLFVSFFWKPYFLFTRGFKCSISVFVIKQIKFIMLIMGYSVLFVFLFPFPVKMLSLYDFLINACLLCISYSMFSLLFFTLFDKSMRGFLLRLKTSIL